MLGFDKITSLSAWARFGRQPAARMQLVKDPPVVRAPVVESGAESPIFAGPGSLRTLSDLVESLGQPEVLRFREDDIQGVADHSDFVKDGFLFFAIPGRDDDGARYAAGAVARGACAVVAQRPLPVPVPCIVVGDVRRTAGQVANAFFGEPSRRLPVIGVTGTNGKTTVADLLRLCLEDDQRLVGSLGTIEYRLGPVQGKWATHADEVVLPAHNTTPGPIDVQRHLREMVDRGVGAALLEVSSHALDQGRTDAVRFSAAVFTNLTQDHLDYHGSMAEYAAAKARLFASLPAGGVAVLPCDDASARPMLDAVPAGVAIATYALSGTAADLPAARVHVQGEIVHADLDGTRLRVETPDGCVDVHLPLVGAHNARNALAAMACAIAMDIGPLCVADALSRARPVRGRLERVDAGRKEFRVFVDYAHTPDALQRVLESLRPLTRGRLRVLFGCGGERDPDKRPLMGKIAAELAHHVVLTHDNPRREDPDAILRQILAGVNGSAAAVDVCPDRGRAIRHVLAGARPGDTVVLAGKGHESRQYIGGRFVPFDDRAVAEECLWSH